MKIYNPFKWHVVEFANGEFAVRRRSVFGLWWVYASIRNPQYTWTSRSEILEYAITKDRDLAIKVAMRVGLTGARKVFP